MLQDYFFPASVEEALAFLKNSDGQGRIIAGGTDLLLDLHEEKTQVACLVDVTRIEGFRTIGLEDGAIVLGAAVTHSQAATSPLIQQSAAALAAAARSVGSLQIRNSATVVGNVVNAQPAADTAVALVALGAAAQVVSAEGVKYVPVEEMYAGVGKSTVDSSCQLVVALRMPAAQKNQGSAFMRLSQRKALALPMLNVAVMVSLVGDRFEWARIAMAPVGPGPVRATKAEEILKGAEVNALNIIKAAEAAVEQANPRSSLIRGSREYRLAVLPVLVRRALEAAVAQARG